MVLFISKECEKIGMCPYPALFSTFFAADYPRIRHFISTNNKGLSNNTYISKIQLKLKKQQKLPSGHILICKILKNKIVEDEKDTNYRFGVSPSQNVKKIPLDNLNYESIGTVLYRSNQSKFGPNCVFFHRDNNLVLPEYLVEFDYTQGGGNTNNKPKPEEKSSVKNETTTTKKSPIRQNDRICRFDKTVGYLE